MDHPLRDARLLEVGETEGPGSIDRVDDIADAERERLSPHHDLITYEGGQRTGLVLPPCVANRILIVELVAVLALAISAVPRIRRLVHEPFAHEEIIVLVETVVLIHLQPGARYCK